MGIMKDQYIEEVERMADDLGCEPDDLEQWQYERAMDQARDRILDQADAIRDRMKGK